MNFFHQEKTKHQPVFPTSLSKILISLYSYVEVYNRTRTPQSMRKIVQTSKKSNPIDIN